MTRPTGDPLSELSVWQRVALQRRLRRAWREGLQERDTTTAAVLATLVGQDVLAIHDAEPDHRARAVTDIHLGGWTLRLDRCHWPTVLGLADQISLGPVALVEARHHGHLWGLYFDTATRRVPLLSRDVRVRANRDPGRGVAFSGTAPMAPALV